MQETEGRINWKQLHAAFPQRTFTAVSSHYHWLKKGKVIVNRVQLQSSVQNPKSKGQRKSPNPIRAPSRDNVGDVNGQEIPKSTKHTRENPRRINFSNRFQKYKGSNFIENNFQLGIFQQLFIRFPLTSGETTSNEIWHCHLIITSFQDFIESEFKPM